MGSSCPSLKTIECILVKVFFGEWFKEQCSDRPTILFWAEIIKVRLLKDCLGTFGRLDRFGVFSFLLLDTGRWNRPFNLTKVPVVVLGKLEGLKCHIVCMGEVNLSMSESSVISILSRFCG